MSTNAAQTPFVVDAIWYRVDGEPASEYAYSDSKLMWTEYRVQRLTPKGAWLSCLTWSHRKPKFANAGSVRWCSPTKQDALARLVARKHRHIGILESELDFAQKTLDVAREALLEYAVPAQEGAAK